MELDKIYSERTELNAEIKRLRDGIQKGFEKLAEIPYCSVLRTIFDNANGVQNGLESLLSPAPVTEGPMTEPKICPECKGPTDNEFRICKGAAAQNIHYGGDDNCNGLASCDCCESCRIDCYTSMLESIEDGDQESQENNEGND